MIAKVTAMPINNSNSNCNNRNSNNSSNIYRSVWFSTPRGPWGGTERLLENPAETQRGNWNSNSQPGPRKPSVFQRTLHKATVAIRIPSRVVFNPSQPMGEHRAPSREPCRNPAWELEFQFPAWPQEARRLPENPA